MGADTNLFGFFGCADVDDLRVFFDMEVRAFWIVVVGPELKRWFVILIFACIILLSICNEFREDLLLNGGVCYIEGVYMFRFLALVTLQDGHTHPSVSISSVRDLCSGNLLCLLCYCCHCLGY